MYSSAIQLTQTPYILCLVFVETICFNTLAFFVTKFYGAFSGGGFIWLHHIEIFQKGLSTLFTDFLDWHKHYTFAYCITPSQWTASKNEAVFWSETRWLFMENSYRVRAGEKALLFKHEAEVSGGYNTGINVSE